MKTRVPACTSCRFPMTRPTTARRWIGSGSSTARRPPRWMRRAPRRHRRSSAGVSERGRLRASRSFWPAWSSRSSSAAPATTTGPGRAAHAADEPVQPLAEAADARGGQGAGARVDGSRARARGIGSATTGRSASASSSPAATAGSWEIDTLLMSCRALGRGVEDAFLHGIATAVAEAGGTMLVAPYLPAPRNQQVREFLAAAGFAEIRRNLWAISLEPLRPRRGTSGSVIQERKPCQRVSSESVELSEQLAIDRASRRRGEPEEAQDRRARRRRSRDRRGARRRCPRPASTQSPLREWLASSGPVSFSNV